MHVHIQSSGMQCCVGWHRSSSKYWSLSNKVHSITSQTRVIFMVQDVLQTFDYWLFNFEANFWLDALIYKSCQVQISRKPAHSTSFYIKAEIGVDLSIKSDQIMGVIKWNVIWIYLNIQLGSVTSYLKNCFIWWIYKYMKTKLARKLIVEAVYIPINGFLRIEFQWCRLIWAGPEQIS